MKLNKQLLLASTILFSVSTVAVESDYEQPIHVSSLKQHAKMKENTVTFSEEVLLTQGTIKITSNELTVTRGTETSNESMLATGSPATFFQTQDDGKPLAAEANNISYDVTKGKITLIGNAQVKQLDSQINGSEIIYFLKTKELTVAAGKTKNSRVNTVFLPAQFEKNKEDNTTSAKEEK